MLMMMMMMMMKLLSVSLSQTRLSSSCSLSLCVYICCAYPCPFSSDSHTPLVLPFAINGSRCPVTWPTQRVSEWSAVSLIDSRCSAYSTF